MSSINTLPTSVIAHCASFLDIDSEKKLARSSKTCSAGVDYHRNITLNLTKKQPFIRLLVEHSDTFQNANPKNYPQAIKTILTMLANSSRLDREAQWIFNQVQRGSWWYAPKEGQQRTAAFLGRPSIPELREIPMIADDVFDAANETNLRGLYLLAQATSDQQLLRTIPIESVGKAGRVKAFYQAVEGGNLPAVQKFLGTRSPAELLNSIRLARATNRHGMMRQLLQQTSNLNLDSLLKDAGRTGDVEALEIIVTELKTPRNAPHTLTYHFSPQAGYNEFNNDATGLQEALIDAVLTNNMNSFELLLQLMPNEDIAPGFLTQALTHLQTYIRELNRYITALNGNEIYQHNLILNPFNNREQLRTLFLEAIHRLLPPQQEPVAIAAIEQPEPVALIEVPVAATSILREPQVLVGPIIALMLAIFVAQFLIDK